MAIVMNIVGCLLALLIAIVIFVDALFVQAGIHPSSHAPIALFGLSIVFFMLANYYGLKTRDQLLTQADHEGG